MYIAPPLQRRRQSANRWTGLRRNAWNTAGSGNTTLQVKPTRLMVKTWSVWSAYVPAASAQ